VVTGQLSLEAGLQQVREDAALRWDRTVDLSLSEVRAPLRLRFCFQFAAFIRVPSRPFAVADRSSCETPSSPHAPT
jgi:hypothetical protein